MINERRQQITERRQHVRYRPVGESTAELYWQDGTDDFRASVLLNDLSEGGCSLVLGHPPAQSLNIEVELSLGQDPPSRLPSRLTGRSKFGDSWLVSFCFQNLSPQQESALKTALASDAFRPCSVEISPVSRKHWRAEQWAAYLTVQRLPVMTGTKTALANLEASEEGKEISGRDFADLANGDPFFCLCLLREAESRRSSRLGHETSTPLAAVMQLGDTGVRELLLSSPETDEANQGLANCESRAVTAARLAAAWSPARADVSPDELVMAALLSEMGELMLWHFSPDLPQAAADALASGEARRSVEAQELRCGFKFKDLTLKCAEIWKLPALLVQLIRGTDNARANIARVCINTARHLSAGVDNPALPDDLADIKRLIPHASLAWLVSHIAGLPEELREDLVEKAARLLEQTIQP